MDIDKSKGVWLNDAELIDDLAYYFYIKKYDTDYLDKYFYKNIELKNNYNPLSQKDFIIFNNNFQLLDYFYYDAEIFLRREKINKIIKRK